MGKTKIVAVTEDIKTAGAVVWWKLSGTVNRDALDQALSKRGVQVKLLPNLPEPEVCLRRALKELKKSRVLVRPLRQKGAWAIINETPRENDIDYKTDMTVKVNKVGRLEFNPHHYKHRQLIEDAYAHHFDELSQGDISGWLIRQVESHLSLRLRENGGVYFVPRTHVDQWKLICEALGEVSVHKTYLIPALKSDDAIAAVLDALTAAVEHEYQVIDAELAEDMGKMALRNRMATCDGLMAKVAAYEGLIGIKMDDLRNKLSELQTSITAAEMVLEEQDDAQNVGGRR